MSFRFYNTFTQTIYS